MSEKFFLKALISVVETVEYDMICFTFYPNKLLYCLSKFSFYDHNDIFKNVSFFNDRNSETKNHFYCRISKYLCTWTTYSYFLHDLDFVSICFVLLLPVILIFNSAFGCKNHKFQRITQGVIFQFHRLGTS